MNIENPNNTNSIQIFKQSNEDPQVQKWLENLGDSPENVQDLITQMIASPNSCRRYEQIYTYINEATIPYFEEDIHKIEDFLKLLTRIHFPHDDINLHKGGKP
jgi:hypothetical protein